MANATGSQRDIAYVLESSLGTTPATPTLTLLRTTGDSLSENREAIVSQELRGDRAISDVRHGAGRVEGDLSFELSYGAFDDLLSAAFASDWQTDTPGAGTDQLSAGTTLKSATVEKSFLDVGVYEVFTGIVVDGLSLNFSTNAIITGSMSVRGLAMTVSTSRLDSSPQSAPTNSPMSTRGGSISEGGSSAPITSLELSLANGVEQQYELFETSATGVTLGRVNVTGTVSAYFQDKTLLDKFVNETESSLEITATDPAGNQYVIRLPRVKYNGGNIPVQSESALQLNMPFQALHDDVAGAAIIIERTAA